MALAPVPGSPLVPGLQPPCLHPQKASDIWADEPRSSEPACPAPRDCRYGGLQRKSGGLRRLVMPAALGNDLPYADRVDAEGRLRLQPRCTQRSPGVLTTAECPCPAARATC